MPVARPILFTQDARAEVIAAQDWYEEQTPGPGARFRGEFDNFRIDPDAVTVIACFHASRDPHVWQRRTGH